MESSVIRQLAMGAVPPALIGGGVLLAFWWRHRGKPVDAANSPINSTGEPFWLFPTLASLLTAALVPLLFGAFEPLPKTAEGWIPHIALGAGLLALAAGPSRPARSMRCVVRAIVLALAAYLCTRNLVRSSWTVMESIAWIGGFAVVTSLALAAAVRVVDRARGLAGPLFLALFTGGVSQVLALPYSSLKLAQVAEISAALSGAACVVALLRPRFSVAFGGAHVPVIMSFVSVFQAHHYANGDPKLSPVFMLLIVASPLLAALTTLPPLSRLSAPLRLVFLAVLTILPIATILVISALRAQPDPGY